MNKPAGVALLAPVPEGHLISALEKLQEVDKVAFGSNAYWIFDELDAIRGDTPVETYIYASHSERKGLPKVRWHGLYNGYVRERGGAHPKGRTYRPDSTQSDGPWVVFWELTQLRELEKDEALPMTAFKGINAKKPYISSFRPEGPLLVEAP